MLPFKQYLYQFVTASLLLVVIEMILPDSNTKKYTSFTLRLALVYTLFAPVFSLIGKN